MMEIRPVQMSDAAFWRRLDLHISAGEFERKVRDGRGYVLLEDGVPAALMRYNLFWDNTPFCTLLYVEERCRGRGHGGALMRHWEADMKARGYGLLMTSTQVDETAQHFYRKLGYRDAGGLLLDAPGYEQPMELFLIKAIDGVALGGVR